MGARGSQDLRSSSPIMVPGDRAPYIKGICDYLLRPSMKFSLSSHLSYVFEAIKVLCGVTRVTAMLNYLCKLFFTEKNDAIYTT